MENGQSWKLLLVEDDADSAEALIMLLSLYDIETTWCIDGEATLMALDAFHRLGQRRPDFALLDLNLPRTDTVRLSRDIIDHPAGCPIILVSAASPELLERSAREIGALAAVRKPFPMQHLIGVLERNDHAREPASAISAARP